VPDSDDNLRHEIGHVLFIDIVGYSKLLIEEQKERLNQLTEIVLATAQVRDSTDEQLVRLPTGDGMALVFRHSAEEPARCALEIAEALRKHPELPVRMGIHSGPVSEVKDVSGRTNIAGAGINMAQRVMDCGDAGHILVSQHVADDLMGYRQWAPRLHDLGECEVKHGVRLHLVNLYADPLGNSTLPKKLATAKSAQRRSKGGLIGALALVALLAAGAVWYFASHRTATPNAAIVEKSIAVLPFENLSSDKENAYFADGVQDEILTNLARIADLKVISRTSVMQYKTGAQRNLREIGQQLGVAHLLEGTVQRAANKVRVNAQLIDARTDAHQWAQVYDRPLDDVLAIQSEIAQKIAEQLGAKLSPRESTELATRPTQDIAAFESYIRARALMETPDVSDEHEKFVEDNTRAVQLLEQAVARDPKFAGAYWALSEANIQLYRGPTRNADYRTRAEAALKEAQRIAPEAGETLHAQARIAYYGYLDYTRALATLEEAAKSLPNNAEVTMTRGLLYRRFGRWQEAFAQFKRATELNPQDPFSYTTAGWTALCLRWWDEGDQMYELMAKRFPRSAREATIQHALSLSFRGDVAAADKQLESVKLQMPGDFDMLFYGLFFKRDFEPCRRLLTDAAKYSELQDNRWEKELQLAFVTKFPFDEQAAREAEKRLEECLAGSISREQQGVLISALSNVKMLLGKKEEALRIAEESVEQHPISEDTVNVARLQWLAYMYLYAGENDRALQTFAKLVQLPAGATYPELKDSPVLDGLRQDPRFEEILKQSQQPFPRL